MFTTLRLGLVAASMVAISAVIPAAAIAQELPATTEQAQRRSDGRPMAIITELLSVSRGDVISHIRTGGTLAELASGHGSSGEALIDALMEPIIERIAQAVDDGGVGAEQASAVEADWREKVSAFVNATHDGPARNARRGLGQGWSATVVETVEELLSVNQGQIVSHLRTGGTLAELADEHGSSGETLADALVVIVDAHLDEKVASGAITQERADELLTKATGKIDDVVYQVHQPGRGR